MKTATDPVASPTPAKVLQHRIPTSDICMADAMPFQQHYEARIAIPMKDVGDMGLALHGACATLKAGDQVIVCAYKKRDWQVMTEIAVFRIVENNNRIKTIQVGTTLSVPTPTTVVTLAPGQKLVVVPRDSVFDVQDGKGNVVETFVDRKQAEAFANRESSRAA